MVLQNFVDILLPKCIFRSVNAETFYFFELILMAVLPLILALGNFVFWYLKSLGMQKIDRKIERTK
jgi:hypothetical protein